MPDEVVQQDAVQLVRLRTDFQRDNHHRVMIALLVSIVLNVLLAGSFVYIVKHPPAPQYFATTINGRITPLIPLDQPNMPPSTLLQWANSAAIAAYTYNFVNYRQELQSASEFFTPDGWRQFINALEGSNNLSAVIDKKLVVSAVATGAPVILDQKAINGTYTWIVQMPMLITYQSASASARQSVMVKMTIERISTLNSARGVGISSFVAA
jgi:intracellular multiplication protein IcmL